MTTFYPERPTRVLLLENIHPSGQSLFRSLGMQVESVPSALSEAELIARLPGVDILGIRSKTRITARVLDHCPDTLSVGCFCIGTNQVDLKRASQRGIPVFNAPFSNTRSVAEMILAEVVMLARQLGDRVMELHAGRWRKVSAGCFEVRGKTLGIVGYGHIGSQVGVMAESFGMRVAYYDTGPKLPMGNNRAAGSLSELLSQSDFVTLHVPETPRTRLLMGAEQLAQMAPGSYLLNASRGSVVDIPALASALTTGHLAGAALDVYPDEPEGNSDGFASALRGLSNVILTPHVGGSTEEAQAAIGKEVATALVTFLSTGSTVGSVNFPILEMPATHATHRIVNVHRNVPGVLRDINRIVSDLNANIHSQMLSTDADIGYLLMDLDQDVSEAVVQGMSALGTDIRTRRL